MEFELYEDTAIDENFDMDAFLRGEIKVTITDFQLIKLMLVLCKIRY